MRHVTIAAFGLAVLAGCATEVPDSGVGFGDYDAYQQQQAAAAQAARPPADGGTAITARELALIGIGPQPSQRLAPGGREAAAQALAEAQVRTVPAPVTAPTTGPTATQTALASGGAVTPGFGEVALPEGVTERDTVALAGRGGLEASPQNAAPIIVDNPSLSSEQDFDAVSDARSIEDDAALRERQAAAYRVIEPGALPERTDTAGPNIVAYALQTTNVRGQQVHTRFAPSQQRFQRNCANYVTPDAAQRDFLARGGPERDRLGIDPDGDGFACGWDPAPFRAAN